MIGKTLGSRLTWKLSILHGMRNTVIKKEGKDQESIQSRTKPYSGHHMGK